MLLIKKKVSWRLLLTIEAAVLVKHVHWLTPNTDLGQPLTKFSYPIFTYLDTLWSHCVRITDILLYYCFCCYNIIISMSNNSTVTMIFWINSTSSAISIALPVLLIPNSTGYPCYHSLIVGQLYKKSLCNCSYTVSFTQFQD